MSCFSCKTRSDSLSTCDVCKRATYCSRECQATHWNANGGHKLACAAENADGELITHSDSLLGRVATKNPQFFGAVRQCESRKVAVPSSPTSRFLLSAVQAAEMPEDDAKRAAARPKRVTEKGKEKADPAAEEEARTLGRKRRASRMRVMLKFPASNLITLKEEGTLTLDNLPPELLQSIMDEVDIETAVQLAGTSRVFRDLFRRMKTTAGILDMIIRGRNPIMYTHEYAWMAELLRRAIKIILGDVYGEARAARLRVILNGVQPNTFYALFLALGRPPGFDYMIYEDYVEELSSFWHDANWMPTDVDPEEWDILKVMCAHPKCVQVPRPQHLFTFAVLIGNSNELYRSFLKTMTEVPNSFHLGYNLWRDLHQEFLPYDPADPKFDILLHIFTESESLNAADWANLFYFSYRQEIHHALHEDEDPDDPDDRDEYGGFPGARPIESMLERIAGGVRPYIPDEVAASLRGIFTDKSVPGAEKQDWWDYIDKTGLGGENWDQKWANVVTVLKANRRTTRRPINSPTAMDAAAV